MKIQITRAFVFMLLVIACNSSASNTNKKNKLAITQESISTDMKLQKIIKPQNLKKGDRIRIVAPAGIVDVEKTKKGIALLEKEGFEIIAGKHIYDKFNRFAGTDKVRLHDLQEAFDDEKCKTIICIRGGYGSIRILENLNFSKFLQNPKWLVGFSDITVLHAELQKRNYMSIHGPMVASSIVNDKASESFQYLMDVLSGNIPTYSFNSNIKNRTKQSCSGQVVGGNLSIIYSLIGITDMLDTNGKILFIEDLGEQLYHLDRMMYSLKIAGKLNNIKALLVGEFIEMKDSGNMNSSVEDIIMNAVKDFDFPVYFDFPAGHSDNNYPIVFGQEYELKSEGNKVIMKALNQ